MPLTPLQKDALAVLAANRSEESHFAGGVVLNAAVDSARYSHDFDIFHELAEEVTRASNSDVELLRAAGFEVQTLSREGEWEKTCTFRRAKVLRGAENVDILGLHQRFPLAAICWAACGKDPGFTPLSLLKMMRRFARVNPIELDKIKVRALDPVVLKNTWIEISDAAETQMTRLADEQPDVPIGVAFVDASGNPGWLGDDPRLRVHAPSLRGCWPTVHGADGV